jgi:hypothetical protein
MILQEFLKSKFLLVGVSLILLMPITVTESYAEQKYEGVVWQLVYIKSNNCQPSDDEVAKMYVGLTKSYFKLYDLQNQEIEPFCITESEYENFQKSEDVNLLILMYDEDAGSRILQSNDLDGIYVHVGNDRLQNHTVIVCDCSKANVSFESALTPWILSHELSHFVLSYKGYSKSTIQESIHTIEKEYDNCISQFNVNVNCGGIKLNLRGENTARTFVVMKPYEPAIGNSLIKFIPDDINNYVLDLQREITNQWLLGSINDKAYMATVQQIVDPSVESYFEISDLDFEIPNGFVIFEEVKHSQMGWKEYLNPIDSKANLKSLLEGTSFQVLEQNTNSEIEQFPNWFKTRALLWTEKRISDTVFFDGIEHLVRSGTIKIS